MSNYHFEVTDINRKKRSVTKLANYISGRKLTDSYKNETYYHKRDDVCYFRIFQPECAPKEFNKLQYLCNEIDKAEKRYDARTAKEFKVSLPNEFDRYEWARLVYEFVDVHFLQNNLCAIVAIHDKKNNIDHTRDNPHVHIIVTTRTVTPEGFNKCKEREWNMKHYLYMWRASWADIQNRSYERNKLDIRVSHERLERQGILDREPVKYLNRIEWQKKNRTLEREREMERDYSRSY